jgi:hypothetical protein
MPTTLSRSLLAVLVPGIIAVAPWLLALVQHTEATLGLDHYPSLGYALMFASAAVAGTIFQGIGSFIEVSWDGRLEKEYGVLENWYSYLSRTQTPEPVGFRYLSRMATALYFDLGMLFATPVFLLGATGLTIMRFPNLTAPAGLFGLLLAIAAPVYFYWSARITHKLLCKTRQELNQRIRSAAPN